MRELRNIRLRRGLSQADLSAKTGVAEYTISEIEAGKRTPRPSTLRKLAQGLGIEVADLYGEADNPLAAAPPSQPSFNHLLEERRARYQRSWRDFLTVLANRIASQADTKGYAPGWITEIAEIPRDITRILFDNGVLGKRETYPTEAEWRQSWEIFDALEELDQAVGQAWRAQIREAELLEQAREANELTARRKQREPEDRSRKEALKDIRAERSESA